MWNCRYGWVTSRPLCRYAREDVLQLEDVRWGMWNCRYVYKGRRFAVRRYEYGGCGIVDTVGSARYDKGHDCMTFCS